MLPDLGQTYLCPIQIYESNLSFLNPKSSETYQYLAAKRSYVSDIQSCLLIPSVLSYSYLGVGGSALLDCLCSASLQVIPRFGVKYLLC